MIDLLDECAPVLLHPAKNEYGDALRIIVLQHYDEEHCRTDTLKGQGVIKYEMYKKWTWT